MIDSVYERANNLCLKSKRHKGFKNIMGLKNIRYTGSDYTIILCQSGSENKNNNKFLSNKN